jgi:hypothetical protein
MSLSQRKTDYVIAQGDSARFIYGPTQHIIGCDRCQATAEMVLQGEYIVAPTGWTLDGEDVVCPDCAKVT